VIVMRALKPWFNAEHEGNVEVGQIFIASEQRAKVLEVNGLATRDDEIANGARTAATLIPLLIQGMHGLGDNIHQRAVIRQLMEQHEIWLETPWPCVYHDLVGPRLKLLNKNSYLRTQAKNAKREAKNYSRITSVAGMKAMRIWYTHDGIRKSGFLGAMMDNCRCDDAAADYRMPIAAKWIKKAHAKLEQWQPTKPLLIYRPLVERIEWNGCAARNPDHAAYAALFNSIRESFFVISIADTAPGKEWIVGPKVKADVECHEGELDFETIAALTASAALMFCSPGFALILAQSVSTPNVCVFGGHESSRLYSAGARFAPFLGIDPIKPCECFSKDHRCAKAIDLPKVRARLEEFVYVATEGSKIATRYPGDKLGRTSKAVHESGRTRSADRTRSLGASQGGA